ncbi:META domain-containing protein [Microbulbifer sp. CAU 1566]|uniref:META domain-containing protein n=1 Tax=Microbulbifer sp. CAU 1566 TaxID=2933269 RepID=UPI0020039ABB|nr:META domain-containing protein [Microbulbifer sp. CAU 1566]MCK7596660.1 META domain-containing protein [Microbulbifer sp. CAU 1566]
MHRLYSLLSLSPRNSRGNTLPPAVNRAALLFTCTLLAACSSGTSEISESPANLTANDKASICDRQWLLESLSVDGREHKPRMFWQKMWRDRPYLGCDKLGFVRGSAGSNPYLGKFELEDSGDIRWLKPPKISRMSGRRKSSELEKDFMLALPRVNQAYSKNDTLVLQGRDGTRLEFTPSGKAESR